MLRLNIAGINLELRTQIPVLVNESFKPFETEGKPDYVISCREVEALPEFPEGIIYQGDCLKVSCGEHEMRCFLDEVHGKRPYAVGIYNWSEHKADIVYLPEGIPFFNEVGNCFFHIAWESLLLHENRMILHSCCIDTYMGGLLFSGQSGIGKSTQGELWCRYENARLINGDRSIIQKGERGWKAFGSPYAGSSRCYVNDSTYVRAIIMLQQAELCSIRRLGMAEAFRRIYAQLTVNDWNGDFTGKICDLTEQIIRDIPVYELACTPDRNAVELLKETLERGDRYDF